jgi:hypothetical protein
MWTPLFFSSSRSHFFNDLPCREDGVGKEYFDLILARTVLAIHMIAMIDITLLLITLVLWFLCFLLVLTILMGKELPNMRMKQPNHYF